MEAIMLGLEITRRLASKIGPYLFVELVLPGGTLLALLLYWYRRREKREKFSRRTVDLTRCRTTME